MQVREREAKSLLSEFKEDLKELVTFRKLILVLMDHYM